MGNASGASLENALVGLPNPTSMLMQSSSGQLISQGNIVPPITSKIHSAEKEMGQIRSDSANEFITTSTKYGGERTSVNSASNYDTNEKLPISDKLEVTVIPVDEEPYSKMITIPSSMIGKCERYKPFINL